MEQMEITSLDLFVELLSKFDRLGKKQRFSYEDDDGNQFRNADKFLDSLEDGDEGFLVDQDTTEVVSVMYNDEMEEVEMMFDSKGGAIADLINKFIRANPYEGEED